MSLKPEHHFHTCPGCARSVGLWEKYVTPFMINIACGSRAFTAQRERLVPLASGQVVELGTGTGLNLPHYDPEKVTHLVGIDPGFSLLRKANEKIKQVTFPTDIYCETAEDMPLADASADSVVSTYTFCSIPDMEAALSEIRRILKPGGKLYFSEHGLSDKSKIAHTQNRLNPYWKKLAGGCNLNRDIIRSIALAGFEFETKENFKLKSVPEFLGYHHFGVAIRPE